jgi:hypothetical protein
VVRDLLEAWEEALWAALSPSFSVSHHKSDYRSPLIQECYANDTQVVSTPDRVHAFVEVLQVAHLPSRDCVLESLYALLRLPTLRTLLM